jgi:hypothetical protein
MSALYFEREELSKMRKELADYVAEEAKRLDEISYQAGDVLDVKASIVLLVVTFLGTLSGQIVSVPDLPPIVKIIQVIAVAALCMSGLLTIAALWPRDFDIPRDPKKLALYVNALVEHFSDKPKPEDLALQWYEQARVDSVIDRITTNRGFASSKSRLNKWAFYAVAASLLAELISLLWLAIWHLRL